MRMKYDIVVILIIASIYVFNTNNKHKNIGRDLDII